MIYAYKRSVGSLKMIRGTENLFDVIHYSKLFIFILRTAAAKSDPPSAKTNRRVPCLPRPSGGVRLR